LNARPLTPPRFFGSALCAVLSAWSPLASAEQTSSEPPTASTPDQQSTTLIAATPKGEVASDIGTGDLHVEQARALFWEAHERYDAGEFAEAAKLFEESYALFPQVEVLFNIALARARSGRCADAEEAFNEYSRGVGASEATRAANENFLEIQRQCWQASGQEAPKVVVPAPAPTPVASDAPAPKPELAAAVLSPVAPEMADTPPPSYWTTQRVAGWSLLGAAAAATGVAIYFDNQRRDAYQANEELENSSDKPDNAGDQYATLEHKYDRAQIGIVVSAAAALGCAAVGAGLLIYSSDGESSATAQVAVDPSGARIGLSGRF